MQQAVTHCGGLLRAPQRLGLFSSILVRRPFSHLLTSSPVPRLLLQPRQSQPLFPQGTLLVAGMKWVGEPKKRCKDCYFEVKDEVTYVLCPTHPRHRQGGKRLPLKTTWIMTHVTNGSHGRKHGLGRRQMMTQQTFRMDF